MDTSSKKIGEQTQLLTSEKRNKTRIQLAWTDIKIVAHPKNGCCGKKGVGEPKVILDGVSGAALPGEFLSIIGASGAGKTTLLNYLSGRLISKRLEKSGTVIVNGVDRSQIKGFSSYSAYVQQDDILFQTMTVRECLEFAAKLKLPGTLQSKLDRVQEIINELRLTKCANTKIGGPLVKGVSGGERKRTSIGVELITDPNLIFLDEPTTGLDSFTATSVMETLKDLAKSGRTIIQTIHQPNSDIFEMFDRLMLLAKGKVIYFNEARLAVDYFSSINHKCPELSNPADYFMAIMSIETIESEDTDDKEALMQSQRDVQNLYAAKILEFSNKYQQSALKNDPTVVDRSVVPLSSASLKQHASWCQQFNLLAMRNFLNIVRLPQTSYVKLIVASLTALFCVILFYDVQGNVEGVQNRNGALFFIVMSMSFNAIQTVILIFPDERPIFLREANNNMYSVSAYFWAKIFSELPSSILTPTVFGSICYFLIGFNTQLWYKFPLFSLILFLIYNASGGYSLIIGCLFSDKQLAVTLTPVLIIPFMLFAGFFVNQDQIPKFLMPFQYASIFKYGYQAIMLNEYEDLDIACMHATGFEKCDPLGTFHSPQSLDVSIYAICGLYFGCYMIAWFIMHKLSTKYE